MSALNAELDTLTFNDEFLEMIMCFEAEISKDKYEELIVKFNGNRRNQIRVNRKKVNKKIKKNMGIKNSACR